MTPRLVEVSASDRRSSTCPMRACASAVARGGRSSASRLPRCVSSARIRRDAFPVPLFPRARAHPHAFDRVDGAELIERARPQQSVPLDEARQRRTRRSSSSSAANLSRTLRRLPDGELGEHDRDVTAKVQPHAFTAAQYASCHVSRVTGPSSQSARTLHVPLSFFVAFIFRLLRRAGVGAAPASISRGFTWFGHLGLRHGYESRQIAHVASSDAWTRRR